MRCNGSDDARWRTTVVDFPSTFCWVFIRPSKQQGSVIYLQTAPSTQQTGNMSRRKRTSSGPNTSPNRNGDSIHQMRDHMTPQHQKKPNLMVTVLTVPVLLMSVYIFKIHIEANHYLSKDNFILTILKIPWIVKWKKLKRKRRSGEKKDPKNTMISTRKILPFGMRAIPTGYQSTISWHKSQWSTFSGWSVEFSSKMVWSQGNVWGIESFGIGNLPVLPREYGQEQVEARSGWKFQ